MVETETMTFMISRKCQRKHEMKYLVLIAVLGMKSLYLKLY